MAKRKITGKGRRGNFRCLECEKPQQYYAQKENLDKHMRVFHNGGN